VAFLADEGEGQGFALALRSELALDPAAGAEAALRAALAVWKAVPLGRAEAARTGFSPGMPRLQGLVMAHDRRIWLAGQGEG
jgi:hypothetical protein